MRRFFGSRWFVPSVVLTLTAVLILGHDAWGKSPEIARGGRVRPCATLRACRTTIAHQKDALAWQKRQRALSDRGLTLDYIDRLGAAISGHAPEEFNSVGFCESRNEPDLEEYGFNGAVGRMQYQWPTWTGTSVYRWFHGPIDYRKDPLLATVAAAIYLAHGGHWSGPWAASKSCHHLP